MAEIVLEWRVMLAVLPPVEPMLARLAHELPVEEGYLYEPKWDGFRALVFRDGDAVDIRSRHDRPLARYFPELVEAFRGVREPSFAIDGEIVVIGRSGFDFGSIMLRLHPSASRVNRLASETPASFIAFDALAVGERDLRREAFDARRHALEDLLAEAPSPVRLSPITRDPDVAAEWLAIATGGGADGVVAKRTELRYRAGARDMVKVKVERTADCVVAGIRRVADVEPAVASLLLGLYDGDVLRHVGVVASFTEKRRRELFRELAPLATTLAGHAWERGFNIGHSPMGRLGGSAGRWDPSMTLDWVPLRIERVAEVIYDTLDGQRFRHPARFKRWRDDRDARSCTFDQLALVPRREIMPI